MDLPPEKWGLDPIFWSYVKVSIVQIQNLSQFPLPDSFRLYNHPIWKVEIVGVVVGVKQRFDKTLYEVDDGTGVATLCFWHNNFTYRGIEMEPLKLSQLASFRARLSRFNNSTDLIIDSYSAEADPNAEVLHWLSVLNLTNNVYAQPVKLHTHAVPPSTTTATSPHRKSRVQKPGVMQSQQPS